LTQTYSISYRKEILKGAERKKEEKCNGIRSRQEHRRAINKGSQVFVIPGTAPISGKKER